MALGHATVRVNVSAFVLDALDANDLPDDTPLNGSLKLTPMITEKKWMAVSDGGLQKLKLPAPLGPFPIDASGNISHQGRDYVKVIAPTLADTNVAQMQWRADFIDLKYGNTRVTMESIFFWAVPGAEVNLAEEVNTAPSSTAQILSRGPRGDGVIGVEEADGGGAIVVLYESPTGPVESDPIPLPAGGASDADIAALVEDPTSETKATLDTTYVRLEDYEGGSADPTALYKQLARNPDSIIAGAVTRNGDGVVTSAPVVWPDNSPGTYTTTSIHSTNAVNGYTITYGSPVTKTYTQPTITRDSSGSATNVPAIVVS